MQVECSINCIKQVSLQKLIIQNLNKYKSLLQLKLLKKSNLVHKKQR
jgi:hypothetical protein